ncbi:acyl-coenzyme A thioesterase 9, mitochondrial-like [Actinia tenebrosa]|uniref:Acyl-coenzyme A thioesterase 9, mitochondrial-like n=1 Tax=Actinia tenebrosa TaxID=6105 RepID=A0A6P8HR65_ACTTE|nr:acyl-coenzyme A thioesterase 9, mitochondrial-like [Actinia tenebrosa]
MATARSFSFMRKNLKNSPYFRNSGGFQLLSRAAFSIREGKVFSSTDSTNDGFSGPEMMHMKEIKYHLRNSVLGPSKYWSGETTRLDLPTLEQPERQDQLPSRRMKDSYQAAILPIGTDLKLRQKYLNFYQTVRLGKILEDLDILAAWIAYLHIHGGCKAMLNSDTPSPHTVVTALVDRIDLYEQSILPDHDIQISGNVTWVGRSSMKVSMDLKQDRDDGLFHILDACFLMVSRDVKNARAALVNPLMLETEEEKRIFKKGEENRNKSIASGKTDLMKKAPTAQESEEIHNLMLETLQFDTGVKKVRHKVDNSILMEDTELSSVFVCNPQQRNSHNKIFGGYLLEKAFTLSWTNACLFSGNRPVFRSMDDIRFRKSVEIGSIVEFTSRIVYTPLQPTKRFQVMTVADVIQPTTGERETTNIFYYTFESENNVRSIAPRTYAEAMRYLNGKRRYEKRQATK